MPKCLFRYQWVKLPRTHLPVGKGIMGYWAKLASRAAFRKGQAKYCGYTNDVMPGMWSGGVVGLKSILGVKSRTEALEIMNTLSRFGYIRYTLDEKTKKLEYVVTDWVVKCSGAECMSGAVYATDGYGFLCLPRNITQRLADQHYTFGESDAWLDLWCHTVWQETGNAFSYLAPAVQFGRLGAALTVMLAPLTSLSFNDETISGTSFSHLLRGVCWEMVMPSEGVKITTLPASVAVAVLGESVSCDCVSLADEQAPMVMMSEVDANSANRRFVTVVRCSVMPFPS